MPESQERLAALLSAFQKGSLSNLACEDLEFVRLIKPVLRKFVKRFGSVLPADIVNGEVISECFVILITRELGRYDPGRGSVQQYLDGIARNAMQRIRARYRPPGSRTRPKSFTMLPICPICEVVLDESFICRRCDIGIPKQMATRTVNSEITHFEDDVHSPERGVFPDAEAAAARIDVASILERVSPLIAAILIGIYVEGEKVQAIARRLKISRFRVHRELRSFRTTIAVEPNPNKDQKRLQPKIGRKG